MNTDWTVYKIRAFSLDELRRRWHERLAQAVARRLPQEVQKWAIIQRHAEVAQATGQHPDRVKAFDLYYKD